MNECMLHLSHASHWNVDFCSNTAFSTLSTAPFVVDFDFIVADTNKCVCSNIGLNEKNIAYQPPLIVVTLT